MPSSSSTAGPGRSRPPSTPRRCCRHRQGARRRGRPRRGDHRLRGRDRRAARPHGHLGCDVVGIDCVSPSTRPAGASAASPCRAISTRGVPRTLRRGGHEAGRSWRRPAGPGHIFNLGTASSRDRPGSSPSWSPSSTRRVERVWWGRRGPGGIDEHRPPARHQTDRGARHGPRHALSSRRRRGLLHAHPPGQPAVPRTARRAHRPLRGDRGISPLAERTADRSTAWRPPRGRDPGRFIVRYGAKYTEPTIEQSAAALIADGVRTVVGVVLTPHRSTMGRASICGAPLRPSATTSSSSPSSSGTTPPASPHSWRGGSTPPSTASPFDRGRTPRAVHRHSLPERVRTNGDPYPDQMSTRPAHRASGHRQLAGGVAERRAHPRALDRTDILEVIKALPDEGSAPSWSARSASSRTTSKCSSTWTSRRRPWRTRLVSRWCARLAQRRPRVPRHPRQVVWRPPGGCNLVSDAAGPGSAHRATVAVIGGASPGWRRRGN